MRALLQVLIITLLCQHATASNESPVVQLPNSNVKLEIDAPDGYCLKISGPFKEEPQVSVAAKRLGAWQKEQILCLADLDLPEASFKVSPVELSEDHGDFGFGPKVGVNLRPRITTSARWPLQANTPTLGVSFKDQAARVVALQATLNDKLVFEMPMVAARFRQQWAIDVQPMNESMSCRPEGVVGASRIACRGASAGVQVQLVIFCRPCAERRAKMQITQGSQHQETQEPWFAVSSMGESQWVIVVRDSIDGQDKVHEFVVAAVEGTEDVQWEESTSQFQTRLVGTALLQVTFFTTVALGFISAAAVARPFLASTALALPYLAQLAEQQDAPILLKSAFASWPFSNEPWHLLGQVAAGMIVVILLHGCAAMLFLRANGPGSAEMMPHGLSFGAWELRAANCLALPLASIGVRIAKVNLASNSFWNLFVGSLGLCAVLGLLVVPRKVLQMLKDWFQEGRVICVQHYSDGSIQYVDRVCDQLRAIPLLQRSRLLGSWTATRSWQSNLAVATIQEVEHHGTCKERGGDHWDRHWSAGPWQPLLPHQSSTSSASQSYTPLSQGLRYRPVSIDSSEPLMKSSGWKSPKAAENPISPLFLAHPVTVCTRYAFTETHGFAGIAGLPWLDVAVPSVELPSLEMLVPQLQLRVQAAQLIGPYTAGAFSACFDASNRKPWWWAFDFLIKVLAGCIVALAPDATIERHWLRIAWVVFMVLLPIWVTYTWPHVHWIENLMTISATLALPGGTAFYLYGNELVEHRQKALLTVLVLGYLPILLAMVVCLYSCKLTKDQDLPENVIGWGKLSGDRLGYARLSLEEDGNLDANREACELFLADAVPVASEGSKAPRIRLPCEVKLPLKPMHLWMKGAIAVSSSLNDRQPQVAVPAELLFGQLQNVTAEPPCATVLTPEDGVILYRDQESNGGLKWQEVLRRFLHGEPAMLREAERVLQEEGENLIALEILNDR